jgi:MFS family permease
VSSNSSTAKPSRSRALRHSEKVDLALLALPTFALALAITIVSTQLGEVARRYTHQTVIIGAIIGAEGVMALWVPLIFGAWSDSVSTRFGGRLPFILAGAIPAAATVALIGIVHGLGLIALTTAGFFFCYFVAYEPYRAMYPDMLPPEVSGRSQSAQAVARGLGTAIALLGGGLLLSVGRALPFAFAALVLVGAIGAFTVLLLRRGAPVQHQDAHAGPRTRTRELWELVRADPALRAFFWANALWEMTLTALKAFIVLYLVVGLHYHLATASLIIGAVALVILAGAAITGALADRNGPIRVVRIALVAYGCGFTVLSLTSARGAIGAMIPFIAVGGGAVMTLAYALLMPLMPEDRHGAITGFYGVSRGVGNVSGPILAGLLIWLTRSWPFGPTHGFQAMWIVCGVASFVSLIFLRRLERATREPVQAAGEVDLEPVAARG